MQTNRRTAGLTACLGLLALMAAARPAEAGACKDGSDAEFAGHPFLPLQCMDGVRGAPELSMDPLLTVGKASKDYSRKLFSPKQLLGRWEGITVYGNLRYEIFLEVWKEKKGSYGGVFMAKNYRTHVKHAIAALAKPLKNRGDYSAMIKLVSWPKSDMPGLIRFAPVPKESSRHKTFDRLAALTFQKRPGQHLVYFKFRNRKRLEFFYEDRSGRMFSEPDRITGYLDKTQRKSL